MKITPLSIPDVLLLEPQIYQDRRGYFFESFNHKQFESIINRNILFVQDNQSLSKKNVLRGLHYQIKHPQGKLIRVVHGEIFDVALDLRPSSPSFGHWVSTILSDTNQKQIWIPEGFAHGFLTLSQTAVTLYKTTDYWMPEHERCIIWNDPQLGIEWPCFSKAPITSEKDSNGCPFSTILQN